MLKKTLNTADQLLIELNLFLEKTFVVNNQQDNPKTIKKNADFQNNMG